MRERTTPFVPAVEGLRGFAALLVLVYHCWLLTRYPELDGGPARAILSTGFLAVDFFFVISAFVLFLPVAASGGEFGSRGAYALRRAARLVPPYWIALVLALVLFPLLAPPGYTLARATSPESVFAHFTFLETELRFLPGYEGPLGFVVNQPLWTLSVEAAFYALLPFVAGAYFRRPLAGLAVAAGVAIAWRVGALELPGIRAGTEEKLLSLLPAYALDFALGMAGAWLYVRWRDRPPGREAALAALGATAALLAIMAVAGGPDPNDAREAVRHSVLVSTFAPLAFAAAALALALAPDRAAAVATNPASRFAGRVSYGVFVLHFMVAGLLVYGIGLPHDGDTADFALLVAATLPLSLLAGWLSYRFVERPIRRAARRRGTARAPTGAASA